MFIKILNCLNIQINELKQKFNIKYCNKTNYKSDYGFALYLLNSVLFIAKSTKIPICKTIEKYNLSNKSIKYNNQMQKIINHIQNIINILNKNYEGPIVKPKHGIWIYSNNYQMPNYMSIANIWVGSFEYDWNTGGPEINVYTYYPKKQFDNIQITYGPDFYCRLLDRDLTLVFDGRINGGPTNKLYKPCWGNKKILPRDWEDVMTVDNFNNNTEEWLKKVGRNMIYHDPSDGEGGEGILQFDVNDNLRMNKAKLNFPRIKANPRYIYREYLDRIKYIQLDLEPYIPETRVNNNHLIQGLIESLDKQYNNLIDVDGTSNVSIDMKEYDIKVQTFLFPNNLLHCTNTELYDGRFKNKFVPVFSCYDLWNDDLDGVFKMAVDYNSPDSYNPKRSYRHKLRREIFNPIKEKWFNRPFRLGIPMMASVHEYEEVIPAMCNMNCRIETVSNKKITLCDELCPSCECPCVRKKTGFNHIDYLTVFFEEFNKFINNNYSIYRNFEGFDFWAATINSTYPNANNTAVNGSIVQNQFLPIQPHAETIIFVKQQLDKLNMLP
jgi:hypothetical protein